MRFLSEWSILKTIWHFYLSLLHKYRKLNQILEYDGKKPSKNEDVIGYLTAAERSLWAETRTKHFSTGINKESLDVIEKVILFDVK